jgi:hypothetical protein
MLQEFYRAGWCRIPYDAVLADWVARTLPAARAAVAAPENAHWLRCGGTWFAGVNVLPNDSAGAVASGPALSGMAVDFIRGGLGLDGLAWEPAQVSVCYPGYPKPMASESEAAFGYRRRRDAAHVDGLIPEGPQRRRHMREHHGFLLGIPMVQADDGASPFVIWEGSHEIVRATFCTLFAGIPASQWGDVDCTDAYQAARRRIFESCRRVLVHARPGEAYVVHRLALHGVAPWREDAKAGADGRMIVYFRPELTNRADWLDRP